MSSFHPMLIHAALSQLHHPPPAHYPAIDAGIPRQNPELLSPRCSRLSLKIGPRVRTRLSLCSARRRVRYDEAEDDGEEYGYNEEITMLESYTESARSEALLVRATVDDEEEVVVIFKGFSSLLSGRTAADPSRSVLPARAVIRSIDVIRGPFDPSNIELLEKGLTLETFKARLQPRNQ